jgi:hypothetical protein
MYPAHTMGSSMHVPAVVLAVDSDVGYRMQIQGGGVVLTLFLPHSIPHTCPSRFPVLLNPAEKEVARMVCLAFGQKV